MDASFRARNTSVHRDGNRSKGKPCPSEKGERNKDVASKTDLREQLYNGGECGPIEQVQLPEAMITSLRGILLDFDPSWFRMGTLPAGARKDPAKFHSKFLRTFLSRHPVFDRAEVRSSGQGVHAIIRLAVPVEFGTDADRQRWAAMVKVIQKLLPTDPDCPGITALTRPVKSINSKNGATVKRLHKGEPVTEEELIGLFNLARTHPFRTVAGLLFGEERIIPCPVCRGDGTRLDALDRAGVCYGGCGNVRLGQLYDVFLKPRPSRKEV